VSGLAWASRSKPKTTEVGYERGVAQENGVKTGGKRASSGTKKKKKVPLFRQDRIFRGRGETAKGDGSGLEKKNGKTGGKQNGGGPRKKDKQGPVFGGERGRKGVDSMGVWRGKSRKLQGKKKWKWKPKG